MPVLPSWLVDLWESSRDFFYRHFFRYLSVSEVGERWAMFNNLVFFFVFCIGLIYAMKPWGLTKWNRNVVKNRRRLRALAFRKLGEELSKATEEQQAKRRRITELSFFQLRDELQAEKISAVDAVAAYQWKALECQEKYNCVVEFIKEATDMAKELDQQFRGKQKPTLFGIPFSVKENFCLPGYDCSRGLAKELEWPVKEECTLVTHLKTLGAIPLVRTTVPQTLLSFMCSSPAYGTTLNPHDVTRTPGGSSGGETCLIAAGGCPFGVGSDIGGSMRIPTHFCGVTSLKPTTARLRATGTRHGVPGIAKLGWSCGFFSKDVSTQSFLLQSTLVPEYFNRLPHMVPLPFETNGERVRLRIGYYDEDGWFPSVPSVKKAVQKAKRILEAAGHELVPFSIPEPERAIRLLLKCIFPDNGAYWLSGLKCEDVDPYLKVTQRMLSIPLWIRWLASKAVAPIDRKGSLVMSSYVRNLEDLRATFAEADLYVVDFMEYWRQSKVDAVVGTVLPFPALQHQYPTKLGQSFLGTAIYNMLDMPAGVVKVHTVTKGDEDAMKDYPNPESVKAFFQHPLYKMVRQSMVGSEGLPVGVQVMAAPYREEICLQVMKTIENEVVKEESLMK